VRTPIPDFTQKELSGIATILQRRYGGDVALELADSELLLDSVEGALTECPTAYWRARGAQFVIFKVADAGYRCQFFYTDADHYGTGRDEYDNLATCVLTLLRVQADHERDSAQASSHATHADPSGGEYQGPAIL